MDIADLSNPLGVNESLKELMEIEEKEAQEELDFIFEHKLKGDDDE